MERIKKIMKEHGQRLTAQKKDVYLVLKHTPQTVIEILTAVQLKKSPIDKATVYRILTGFIELGIAREINLGDREARFELADCEHHHHLVCQSCGDIKDVKLCEDTLLKEAQKQTSFKIKSHSLEFFGTCEKCQ